MSAYVQILAQDCQYHSACIAIFTENHRYLIEAGEGAQRLAVEHKVRIGKIAGIFLTSYRPHSVAGLPGMLLTLDDAGIGNINIYGPRKACQYLQATKYFMRQLGQFHYIEGGTGSSGNKTNKPTDNIIKNSDITIYAIPLSHDQTSQCDSVSYLCETPKIPGKFYVEKATELGIPKGPLYGKLKSGHNITLDNGTVVHPEQVLGEPTLPKYFAVICRVDGYNSDMMSYLTNSAHWNRFKTSNNNGSNNNLYINLMIHMSDCDAIDSPAYQAFIEQFGSQTKHLFIGKGCTMGESSFIAQTFYNAQLHRLFGSVFPSISKSSTSESLLPDVRSNYLMAKNASTISSNRNSAMGCMSTDEEVVISTNTETHFISSPLVKYYLLPTKKEGFEWFDIPNHEENVDKFITDLQVKQPDLWRKIRELQTLSINVQQCISSSSHTPESLTLQEKDEKELMSINSKDRIVFLGTGCAIPSKYRNVSSILLYLEKKPWGCGVLLDAGEGTWNQLLHLSPPCSQTVMQYAKSRELQWSILLKVIWISHPHADHHLGIVTIIQERRKHLLQNNVSSSIDPITIIAPFSVYKFLEDCIEIYPEIKPWFVYVPTKYFEPVEFCMNCVVPNSYNSLPQKVDDSIDTKGEVASSSVTEDNDDNLVAKRPRLGNNNSEGKGKYFNPIPIGEDIELVEKVRNQLHEMGIVQFRNVPVVHCNQAYGVILSIRDKSSEISSDVTDWKLVYSGDTRPCDNLIKFGRDATVLIHEATFEDDKATEAMNKRHSTISEAEGVCEEMGANRLIMTHFSQRYHGVPGQFHPTLNQTRFVNNNEDDSSMDGNDDQSPSDDPPSLQQKIISTSTNSVIAFDLMSVSVPDLIWTTKLTPLLAELFPAEDLDPEDDIDQMMLG